MPTAVLPPATNPSLDESHHRELAAAARRREPIRRAARVATFNAWTAAILAVLSAPFALMGTVGLLAFVALAVVAWNEFRGRRRLLGCDPAGASILGWNQVGFLALITVYCLWELYSNLWGSASVEAQLRANPQFGAVIDSIEGFDQLYRTIAVALYGSVIALSIVFQGGNALYYFSRRKYVEAYLRETPAWAIDLERATRTA